MTDNGDMKIRRPTPSKLVPLQDFYVDMPKALQDKLFAEAEAKLETAGGWRVWPLGKATRRKMAECFVDAARRTTDEAEARAIFRRNLKDEGFGNPFIMLLLSVFWDLFWLWWTNRPKEA